MAVTGRAVTRDSLGAWLIKASGSTPATRDAVRTGFSNVTTRCLRASYRTDLVRSGQPVLLWISGNDADHPAGIHAQGWTTGPAVPDPAPPGDGSATLVVPLRLEPVEPPVLRSELRHHPELSALEVLWMPAGSNPSYLTRSQLDALRGEWPEVTVG
jgi:hypothetical protein